MTRRHKVRLTCVIVFGAALAQPTAFGRADLPDRLTDQAFWKLSVEASEPGGYFRSQDITNLTSNEVWFQHVIPDLVQRTTRGGVYLGVGPEQNFTYIAAIRPKMAVIFDIRRGNLDIQLMYKAIFELSTDRADFVAMLFSRPRPAITATDASAAGLFRGLAAPGPTDTLFRQNLAAVERQLLKVHALPLRASDLAGIRTIYQTFHESGVAVRPSPTYADLMTATDADGVNRSFLASEASFEFLKDLEARNLVVPVVGDFAGPKAIRAVGSYLKIQGATVSAFYLSNVEQYLDPNRWDLFCRSVATLPLAPSSTFIRSTNAGGFGFGRGGGFISSLGRMTEEIKSCPR